MPVVPGGGAAAGQRTGNGPVPPPGRQTAVSYTHLENLLGRSVFGLSGGEKQILALASIYAVNPDIYVLDEPTANIDKMELTGCMKFFSN